MTISGPTVIHCLIYDKKASAGTVLINRAAAIHQRWKTAGRSQLTKQTMTCLKLFVLAALVVCFIDVSHECGGSSGSDSGSSDSGSSNNEPSQRRAHDIDTQQGLTNLYNKKVVKAERVERPMSGFPGFKHSGVRVTLEDGSQQLIHKGKGYGESGQTVVTDARHMSSAWEVTAEKKVEGARVGDYVATGGEQYNVATDNCHDASERMMELGDEDDN